MAKVEAEHVSKNYGIRGFEKHSGWAFSKIHRHLPRLPQPTFLIPSNFLSALAKVEGLHWGKVAVTSLEVICFGQK